MKWYLFDADTGEILLEGFDQDFLIQVGLGWKKTHPDSNCWVMPF